MGDIIDRDYLYASFDKRRIATLVDDGTGGSADVVDDLIDAAESEVRAYTSTQYTLAQLQADPGMKRACAVITMYSIELRRSDMSEGVKLAYSTTLESLRKLRDGDAKLAAVDQVLPRITQTNAVDVFEKSGYFEGYPVVDNE